MIVAKWTKILSISTHKLCIYLFDSDFVKRRQSCMRGKISVKIWTWKYYEKKWMKKNRSFLDFFDISTFWGIGSFVSKRNCYVFENFGLNSWSYFGFCGMMSFVSLQTFSCLGVKIVFGGTDFVFDLVNN